MPVLFPGYPFLVVLRDAHGAEAAVGGFTEADGVPRKLKGIQKLTHVTLKRRYVNSQALWNWMEGVRHGGVAQRPNVILTEREESSRPVRAWRLNHGVPLKYTAPTLWGEGQRCGDRGTRVGVRWR